ncbi:histidine kinase [Halobacteriales archaeon QS_1_67_19]|nr:MAG: histidine kinase [Halobacteriales archaeon QS_1_67_19]
MASETTTAIERPTENVAWKGGALAGLAGGVVMGAMLTVQMTPVIEVAIPSMYGLSGMAAGWVAHLFHSIVLGVVFAGIAGAAPQYATSTGRSTALGIAYGVALWIVLAAIVMPIWLSAVGSPASPRLPNFNPMSLVGHAVYGAVLGAAFPSLRDL